MTNLVNQIINAMVIWMKEEYGTVTAPVETNDGSGVYNIAETNADYDENLSFGVNVNIHKPSIIWYIERHDRQLWSDEKVFSTPDELISFLNSHDFEEITGDECYERSGYSKYEGEMVSETKVVILVTPKNVTELSKAELKALCGVDDVILFGNGTNVLKCLLDALKTNDPFMKKIYMTKMINYITEYIETSNCYYEIVALFCDGLSRPECEQLVETCTCITPNMIGTITENLKFEVLTKAN